MLPPILNHRGTLLRSINSWCQSSARKNHSGGSKTQRATANGMPGMHRPQAGRVCGPLPASPGHRMSNKKRASHAFPPQSNPSLECLEKAHFSNAMTGGLLRGVFFHPLVESTQIFKKNKVKQNKNNKKKVTSGRSFPVEPTPRLSYPESLMCAQTWPPRFPLPGGAAGPTAQAEASGAGSREVAGLGAPSCTASLHRYARSGHRGPSAPREALPDRRWTRATRCHRPRTPAGSPAPARAAPLGRRPRRHLPAAPPPGPRPAAARPRRPARPRNPRAALRERRLGARPERAQRGGPAAFEKFPRP